MKRIYSVTLLLLLIKFASAQLVVKFGSAVASTSDPMVDIDVVVADWDNIVSTQFSINWDPAVFRFASVENVTTVLDEFSEGGNIGTPINGAIVEEGQLTVSWSLSSTNPTTLPDDTRLFTIRMQAIGNNCDQTALTVTNIPRTIEVIDDNLSDIGLTASGGELSIDDGSCPQLGTLSLNLENMSGENGSTVCFPVTATNFNDVVGLSTGISWSSSVLRFKEIKDGSLSNFTINSDNSGQGVLGLSWSGESTSLQDGATLFEICFDVIGSAGRSTDVSLASIDGFPLSAMIGDQSADIGSTSGSFNVSQTMNMDGVGLISDAVFSNGETNVCVSILTQNFTDIESFQFGLRYDPNVLEYTGKVDQGVSNPTVVSLESEPGILRVLWLPAGNDPPLTLEDGMVMFDLCFDVIGNQGESSAIEFIDVPRGDPTPPGFPIIFISNGTLEFFTQNGSVTIGNDSSGNMDGVGFIAGDIGTNDASSICIPVTTKNFENILSFQTAIGWDPNILSYTGINNGELSALIVNEGSVDEGLLRVLFFDVSSPEPVTLADDAVLFELCFDVIGNDGDKSIISFMSIEGFKIEVSNGNGQNEDFFIDNGSVTVGKIDGGGGGTISCENDLGDNLALFVGSGTVKENEEICVPVSVGNFNNIQSMQFTITWDNTILEYVRTQEFNLSDLSTSNFNQVSDNKIRVSWTPLASQSVDDCASIFEICFRGIGSCVDMGSSMVSLVDDGAILIEITDETNQVLDPDINNGTITMAECDAGFQVSISQINDAQCAGEASGSVQVSVSGGEASCVWMDENDMIVSENCNLEGVGPGTYRLTAVSGTDTVRNEVTIGAPSELSISVNTSAESCEAPGSVNVDVSGGTPLSGGEPYSFSYMGPQELADSPSHSDVMAGEYTVTVTDANQCSTEVQFTVPDSSLQVTSMATGVTNVEGNNGSIIVTGEANYTYLWEDGSTTNSRQNLSPGTYMVTVSDEAGTCSTEISFEIDWMALFLTEIVDESTMRYNGFGVSCGGAGDGMISGMVVGGCKDGAIMIFIDGEEAMLPFDVGEGTYELRAVDACGNEAVENITISAPDEINLDNVQTNCSDEDENNGSIVLTISGGVGGYVINSDVGDVNDRVIENLGVGTYSFTISDANNCTKLFEDVEIEACAGTLECSATSIISPNGDEINDNFVIGCLMGTRNRPNKLVVYNRWGNEVFQAENYDNTWNGVDNDGVELAEGAYLWALKISPTDQATQVFRGTVTLLRSN